ncbi:MAG TPA: carboxypeptidase regulatory-like domain-containing protein [Bacteroidales bacterium]|nr:carboxypeptidase regulatory-like domain-containing protein [Bacteroidales bacterium]
MKKSYKRLTLFLVFAMMVVSTTFAQVTTSGIKGHVVDENGQNLPGATITALHEPSGTQYAGQANADGLFNLNNMRVGGPYTITISFIGYASQVYNNVTLSLGNVADIQVKLMPSVTELNEVVVSVGRNAVINSERTGAAINVNNEMAASVPTISRGLKDFTKISPLANTSGSGTSFAGANNRYNQFSIDGLVTNDVFGLTSSGTNGGQTGVEPISLDAIEEFQINIAPYDVRENGFTGGGINAVTKSGTNKYQGSVYFYGNNQKLVGRNNAVNDTKNTVADYKDYQYGFTAGGPIIKNKLFFFINGEMTRKITPLAYVPGTTASNITLDEVQRVLAVINRVAPNYDPGAYLDMNNETNSNKFLVKLNWNISNKHKLVLRHSYTYGENIDNSRSANSLRFYNNGMYFPSTTNSTGLELNSVFGSNMSNKLSLGYTRVRDDRDPLGDPFPQVLINIGNSRTITFGSEYSSVANQLDQDIYTITDDFSYFMGKHTITVGTHNELYSFYNLFVQNIFGSYAYNNLANFETVGTAGEVSPTYYAIGYSLDPNDGMFQTKGAADWKAMQLGFYAQDEYQVTKNFLLTAGLRIDIPMFTDKPEANETFNTAYEDYNVATGVNPKTRIMWSPRLGFNWDVLGDKSVQVRGGTGLFTGRVPFVWISNQFTNNGLVNGSYSKGSSSSTGTPIGALPGGAKMTFIADPAAQRDAAAMGGTAGSGAINVVDPDFKFPQVFRTNLAVDVKLPWDIYGTVEGVFSKTYNNVNFINLNRQVDAGYTFNGADTRPRYLTGRVNSAWDEIIKFENTNKGYSYNVVFMLQKQFKHGLNAEASYTYGRSMDLNSGTSSVAYSNWRYVNNVYGLNDLRLSRSNFDLGSRVTGLISYKFEYLKGALATQISLFYNGQSGQPLSYIYNGDMNNDGTTNDLIYVPRYRSEINLVDIAATSTTPLITADQQWASLWDFIIHDPYLKNHRGEYAKRNGARLPFSHQFDVRIVQDIKTNIRGTGNKLQLSLDIINIGNLFDKDWGHSIYASNQQFNLINIKSTSVNPPTFTYTGAGMTADKKAYTISDFSSRWRMQIGIRYLFN